MCLRACVYVACPAACLTPFSGKSNRFQGPFCFGRVCVNRVRPSDAGSASIVTPYPPHAQPPARSSLRG